MKTTKIKGFTLFEIIVAILIFSILILSVLPLMIFGIRNNSMLSDRLIDQISLENFSEEVKSLLRNKSLDISMDELIVKYNEKLKCGELMHIDQGIIIFSGMINGEKYEIHYVKKK